MSGEFDFYPDMIRGEDRDTLAAGGHNLVATAGFHVCYAAFNTRDYVPDDAGQPNANASLYPLNLTSFRLAMAWAGLSMSQKETAITDIYGAGTVTPAYSIIPEALGVWNNPATPKPGGNYTKAAEILINAGFDNTTTPGTLLMPNGQPMITIDVQSPVEAPTSVEFCQRFVDQWNDFFQNYMGTTAPVFNNDVIPFNTEVVNAFLFRNFQMYWLCWGLSRFPDYLYDFFHSSQDGPWYYNSPGIHNATLDAYIETIKWGLDLTAKYDAAHAAQVVLYQLTPYIYFYHRTYWEGIRGSDNDIPSPNGTELLNYIKQEGVGTDNGWTWALMHWASAPTGGHVNYIWGAAPDNLHPGWADSAYEIWLLNRISDGLMGVNPELVDMPWRALDWKAETFTWAPLGIALGTKVTYRVRSDMYWNDGFPITVEDMWFSWNFMRNFPRFYSTYEYLLWIEIEDPQTIAVYLDTTSQFIIYDYAGLALWFPEHIYSPAKHPTRDTINDPVWEISWSDWMADYTGIFYNTTNDPVPYALVNCGDYDFTGYDETAETATLAKHAYMRTRTAGDPIGDFFEDSPIEGAIDMPGRVGLISGGVFDGTFDYSVQIINTGSKDETSGNLTDCNIDYYQVFIDGAIDTTNVVSYPLAPFANVTFGPHTSALTPGVYNFTVVVYESGVADPIDKSIKWVIVTPREDLNYDIFIGIDDIVRAAEAFGASPPPFPGNERWDSRADLNDDYYCGIDDIVNIAEDFGGP
jgi:ABC-type transport system substrate-binding protein